MADKLAESIWTGFTKKQKLELDDAALRKALAKFDKTDEAKPAARLDALGEVVEQLKKQILAQAKRKKELGDKLFGQVKDQLNELLDEAEALQRKTAASHDAAGEEGDDESPALLTTKMVPLLRELRKGEAQMNALICLAGKKTAVLILRRSISPAQRKVLATAVDATGGMKYVAGHCLYEGNVLTFVVASPAAQLAKRLREALLAQTDLRLKVKVRGEDGSEETDGEDEGLPETGTVVPEAPPLPSAEQLAYQQLLRRLEEPLARAVAAGHGESVKLGAVRDFAAAKAAAGDWSAAHKALETLEKLLAATPTGDTTVDPAAAFKARMLALVPRIKEAQQVGHPGAPDAKLKASEAGVLAGKHDFDAAAALLDEVEALLAGGTEAAPTAPTAPPATGGKVAFARLKLQWNEAKARLEADLENLRELVLSEYDDAETAQQAHKILRITGRFNEGLADTLDDLYNAAEPALQKQLRGRASEIVGNYQAYLDGDALVAHIEENPFMPLEIRERLSAPLQQLREQLA